jgi:hypothetical protein
MEPLLGEQRSRMNMKKTRLIFYRTRGLPVAITEAIKEAGVKYVTTTVEEDCKQHIIHKVPVGRSE